MSRGPSTFKERDLTRAVRAVVKAGLEVTKVTVDTGGQITVIVGHGNCEVEPPSELDQWLGKRGRTRADET